MKKVFQFKPPVSILTYLAGLSRLLQHCWANACCQVLTSLIHCVPGSAYSQDVEITSSSFSISNIRLWVNKFFPCCKPLNLCSIKMKLCTLRLTQSKNLRRNTLRENHCSGVLADQPLSNRGHGISTGLWNRRWCVENKTFAGRNLISIKVITDGMLTWLCIFHLAVCITQGIKAPRRIK